MLLPTLPKPKTKSATQQVGDILRQAALDAKRDESGSQTRLANPLAAYLSPNLQSGPLPPLPTYPPAPPFQFLRSYGLDPELSRLMGRHDDGINPLDLQFNAMKQRGQAPSQADFALANAQGDTASARNTLGTLYPNGFEATAYDPLSLPGLTPRAVPSFPGRPRPGSDVLGSLLAGIAGFVDPVGAGQYNAEPLRAAAQVANQQYDDRLKQFEYAVQQANAAYGDQRDERNAQFDATLQNQRQQNLLRDFDQRRKEQYANLVGSVEGGTATGEALRPLAERSQAATVGGAMDDFLTHYLATSQRDAQIGNEAKQNNWRNQFDLAHANFKSGLELATERERMRNNTLDLLGSVLRPQFDPLLGLRSNLLNSQIGVNKAREQDILNGGTGGDPEAMRLRALNTAIRIATNGGDPSAYNLPAMPGVMEQAQAGYQQKATALQMRDPRIRAAEDDVKSRVLQRDILFREYQAAQSQGKFTDPDESQSYRDAIARADSEVITASKKRNTLLNAISLPPRTVGTSTRAPQKEKVQVTPRTHLRAAPPKQPANVTPTFEGAGKPAPNKPKVSVDYSRMSTQELMRRLGSKVR